MRYGGTMTYWCYLCRRTEPDVVAFCKNCPFRGFWKRRFLTSSQFECVPETEPSNPVVETRFLISVLICCRSQQGNLKIAHLTRYVHFWEGKGVESFGNSPLEETESGVSGFPPPRFAGLSKINECCLAFWQCHDIAQGRLGG